MTRPLEPTAGPGTFVPSVCPHDCSSTCALEVEVLDARTIGRVRGARENSYTAGVICSKVGRYAERVHHPARLRTPLRRVGDKATGRFVPIGWDDALDEVAEAFTRAVQRYGSETVWPYYYAGTMGLVQRDGINRLRHVMRYSGFFESICTNPAWAGWRAGIGALRGIDARELAETDLVVIWGMNPVNTQVNVMTHVARARRARGAKLVVVDPYRTGTAEVADMHLALRPGTDGALACAVLHVLFAENYVDRDYLARHTDFPPDLESHLSTRTPEWAARITGLGADGITAFARLYGRAERKFLRVGYGFTRSRNGAAAMHAVTCLPAATGAWKQRGGGALHTNAALYHWDKTLIEGLDAREPGIRMLDQSRIGRVLTGDRRDLGDGPPVTGLLIQNTNPMTVAPELGAVHAGFARPDLFVCVHEQFMTDTARMADIVLPATTVFEHDDIYQSGGHMHIHFGRKLIEPCGESRSNHDVINALAKRLGAQHPGFLMTAGELADATLRASGWPDLSTLRSTRWHDCQPDFETSHFLDGFGTPDGRFHFAPDWSRVGRDHAVMPRLPDHLAIIEEADETHPWRLVTAPARSVLNTSFTETPGSLARERRPTVLIHPEDADALGVHAGARVRVGNRRGSVVLHAAVFDGLQRGVLVAEGIWPCSAFEEGVGINVLIGADSPPPNGGAAVHDTAVWIRPA